MKSKQLVALFALFAMLLVSCETKFTKLSNGVEYKIISNGKGNLIKDGNIFEFTPYATYSKKDSLLVTDDVRINQLVRLDSTQIDKVYYSIFKQLREGDSVILKEKTDSILTKTQLPWMSKGYSIISSYKIQKIYLDSASADAAQKRIMIQARAKDSIRYFKKIKEDSIAASKQIIEDDKVVKEYLSKNNIKATKTAMGVYVEMITPGTGTISDSNGVKVNYTGKNFKGKVFDSNLDPQFNHVEPLVVNLFNPGSVIKGWEDGLKQLSKGAKARLYIPSALAYGKEGRGAESGIGPNENLIFDIEITDVLSKNAAEAELNALMQKRQIEMMKQQKMQQAQQRMQQGNQNQPQQAQPNK